MRDAFDCVTLPVSPVVGRVDAPAVSSSVMTGMFDSVHYRISHLHIVVLHIDAGSKNAMPFLEYALTHLTEETQIFVLDFETETGFLPQVCRNRLVVRISQLKIDHRHRQVRRLLKVLPRHKAARNNLMCNKCISCFIAKPFEIIDDSFDISFIFCTRISVIESQIASTSRIRQLDQSPDRLLLHDRYGGSHLVQAETGSEQVARIGCFLISSLIMS